MANNILLDWEKKHNIYPDGSLRTFIRGLLNGKPVIMIKPSSTEEGIREAIAFYNIGRHLKKYNINIPKIYYFDKISGILFVEDLGDILLERLVSSKKNWDTTLITLYKKSLTELLRFQFIGAKNFNYNWCFDTPKYDSTFALKREGFYFLDYLLIKFFNVPVTQSLKDEIIDLFTSLEEDKIYYGLMHRDFQSRNLIYQKKQNEIYIIDFQGARLGPVGYDLASILHDPYVMMPLEIVDKLKKFYIKNLKKYIFISEKSFEYQFRLLSLFRLMQALGAFAKLSLELNKLWFKRYISSAINRLNYCLSFKEFDRYKQLRQLLKELSFKCNSI